MTEPQILSSTQRVDGAYAEVTLVARPADVRTALRLLSHAVLDVLVAARRLDGTHK